MKLNALRYFVMVATTGSFVTTAKHFEVSASSVSRFISELEKNLGQQLFYRNTRSIRLTDLGEKYYHQIKDVIESLDLANEQMMVHHHDMKGLVKINTAVALGRLHLSRIINKLQDVYPNLSVELVLTDTFVDLVQEGVDIAIRISSLQDSTLIARKICDQQYVLCASPEYLDQYGIPNSPSDLKDHLCIVYKGLSGSQLWYFSHFDHSESIIIKPQGKLTGNNAEVLTAAALDGKGIVLFPTWMFSKDTFKNKDLIPLLPEWTAKVDLYDTGIHLVSPENRIQIGRAHV